MEVAEVLLVDFVKPYFRVKSFYSHFQRKYGFTNQLKVP